MPQTAAPGRKIRWGTCLQYAPHGPQTSPPAHQLPQLKVPAWPLDKVGRAELWSMWSEQGQYPGIFKFCSSSLLHNHRGRGTNQRGREERPHIWNAVERKAPEDKKIKQSKVW